MDAISCLRRELASIQQRGLETLRKLVESTTGTEALLALFSLFVEEWRLLGRARLRQEVRDRC